MRKAVRGNGEEIWSPGGVSLSPTSTCSSTGSSLHPLLWGLYGGFVTEMWLMKSLATGDWTQSPDPLPSPEWGRTGGGGDRKFQPFNHIVGFIGNQAPSSGEFQSLLINMTKDTFVALTIQGFKSSKGGKDQIHARMKKMKNKDNMMCPQPQALEGSNGGIQTV